MKELAMRFWSTESYAVRLIRVVFVGIGLSITNGEIPLPAWVGVVLCILGAAITGNGTKSGLPEGGN